MEECTLLLNSETASTKLYELSGININRGGSELNIGQNPSLSLFQKAWTPRSRTQGHEAMPKMLSAEKWRKRRNTSSSVNKTVHKDDRTFPSTGSTSFPAVRRFPRPLNGRAYQSERCSALVRNNQTLIWKSVQRALWVHILRRRVIVIES